MNKDLFKKRKFEFIETIVQNIENKKGRSHNITLSHTTNKG